MCFQDVHSSLVEAGAEQVLNPNFDMARSKEVFEVSELFVKDMERLESAGKIDR